MVNSGAASAWRGLLLLLLLLLRLLLVIGFAVEGATNIVCSAPPPLPASLLT
jgi:hypothetical protein